MTQRTAALAAAFTALLLVTSACGSANNPGKSTATAAKSSAVPTSSSAARPAANTTTERATPKAPSPSPTNAPTPTETPSPELTALVQKLTPVLIQTADLPQAERGFSQTGVTPVSNTAYARGRKDAAEIAARLDKDARIGGVQNTWGLSAQYTPGLKATIGVSDFISEYGTVDGAKDGLALIFDETVPAAPAPGQPPVKSSTLDLGTVGDESRASRVEQQFTAAANTPGTPTLTTVDQVFYVVAWRRGTAVAVLVLNAVNQDPSLDELKQIVQAQDSKLQAAGY